MSCDGVARLKYYQGQLLSARDFSDQQAYHRLKHQLLLRRFESGIIGGLEVTCAARDEADPSDFDGFLIKEGLAVDPLGREIFVSEDGYKVPVTEFNVEKPYLSLRYFEQEDRVGTNLCETETRNNRIFECVEHRWEGSPNIPPSVTVALIEVKEENTGSCDDFTIELLQDASGRRIRLNARLVDTNQLADSAVTTEKIRNRAVTIDKISDEVKNKLVTSGENHDHTDGSGGRRIPEGGLADQAVTRRTLHPEVLELLQPPSQCTVYVGSGENQSIRLLDGMALTGDMLMQGLRVEFENAVDTSYYNPATCHVSFEIPYPLTETERSFWGDDVLGYRIHTLPGGVDTDTNEVQWFPLSDFDKWLEKKVFRIRRSSSLSQAGVLNTSIFGPGREYVGGIRDITLGRQLLVEEAQYLYAKLIANTANVEFGLVFNQEDSHNYWAVVYREYTKYQSGPGDYYSEQATWTHYAALIALQVRNGQPIVRFQDEIQVAQSVGSPVYTPAGREVHVVMKRGSTGLLIRAGELQTKIEELSLRKYAKAGIFMRNPDTNQIAHVKVVYPDTVEKLYPGTEIFDPYRGTRLLTRLTLKSGSASGANDPADSDNRESGRWFWLVPAGVYYPYQYYGYPFPAVDFAGIGGELL